VPRRYPAEFRRKVLDLVAAGRPVAQGATSATSGYGGTGLDLAICREVAATPGGRITVQSKPGQDSTFSLYLPVADTEKTPEAAVEDPVVPATYGAGAVAETPPDS
jgi:hypothetical protein